MESPLDILSRAAGMHQKRQIISDLDEKEYSGPSVNQDCKILKLALVRNKNHPGNLEPNYQPSTNDKDRDSSSQSGDEEDLDKPLDMSINKLNSQMKSTVKRKSDTTERNVIVHKRPSVIVQYTDVQCDIVDEHFKRALGIQSYNEVFKRDKKPKPEPELCDSSRDSRDPPSDTSDEVDVKPIVQVGNKPSYREEKPISNTVSQLNSTHTSSSSHELSVDDHFAKALGKSTWMRLQTGKN